MRKGVAAITRKVSAIKDSNDRILFYFASKNNRTTSTGLNLGELRELTDAVTAKPVLATARKKKAGKKK